MKKRYAPKIAKMALLSLAATALLSAAGIGHAQSKPWPNKPIKFVVCFPPGNAADVFARAVGPVLSEKLGQPVVVENKAGAGGLLGVEAIAKGANDGHTVGVCSLSPITILPAIRKQMPYDVERDLAPIVLSNKGPMVLVVRKMSPFNTLQEFLAYARQNPGKLTYASLGAGTISQMSTEAFKMAAGIDVAEASYRGSGPALTDLMGGHVDVMLDGVASASAQIAAGSVKALAVTTRTRSPLLPDVPAMNELGIAGLESFDFFGWVGFFAPSSMPAEHVNKLNQEISTILTTPAVQERARVTGQEIPEKNSPQDFKAFIRSDFERWSSLAKTLKIENM